MMRYFTEKDEGKKKSNLKGKKTLKKSISQVKKPRVNAENHVGDHATDAANIEKHGVRRGKDPYPNEVPVSKEKIRKYQREEPFQAFGVKSKFNRKRLEVSEKKNKEAVALAARSELLLNEEVGYLECDDEDLSYRVRQKDIVESVDITSAAKVFDLKLPQFGPYYLNFSRNGRNLLLGGSKGHVAAIDWVTKKLFCEINVMESIHDIAWLHMPTMFAVAQKNWVHVYDQDGVELHCVKKLYRTQKLEFLPYHFLLAAGNDVGYLSWLDISIGQIVSDFNAKSGKLDVMTQNPSNAILLTGHPNGVVKMWSPNEKESLVSILCHQQPVRAMAVDNRGTYLATASVDRSLKIWDLRTYKCLKSYKLGGGAGSLSFSQRGLLSVSLGNRIEVYKDITLDNSEKPYLKHSVPSFARDLQFCPYEDALGIGHGSGYSSILVPGSGEPNFDAFESNPYMSKNQMREMEVKALLEKIQPEMITLNPRQLGKVDAMSLRTKLKVKEKVLYVKTPEVDFEPYHKPKKGERFHLMKKQMRDRKVQEKIKITAKVQKTKKKPPPGALGRFTLTNKE